MDSKWLNWAQQLQAIAQHGFTYCKNPYGLERYGQIRQIAAEILATHTNIAINFSSEAIALTLPNPRGQIVLSIYGDRRRVSQSLGLQADGASA